MVRRYAGCLREGTKSYVKRRLNAWSGTLNRACLGPSGGGFVAPAGVFGGVEPRDGLPGSAASVRRFRLPAEGHVALMRDVVPILTGLSISAPGGRRGERQFPIRLFVPPEASSPRSEAPEGSDPV